MTAFLSRFRLFRTWASLGLPLLAWVLLLPAEAVSRTRFTADEQQTVEVPHPRGHNPLTPREIGRVKQIAGTSDKVRLAIASAAASRRPPGSERLATIQLLYAQRYTDSKNADPQSRKGYADYYNYATNERIRVVVDLNSNTVQETQVLRGAANQPPPTRPEIETVLQGIYNSSEGDRLRKAFFEIKGVPLTDVIRQLPDAQGGIYFYDPATPMGPVTADCVQDRCIQLFIPLDEASYIDMTLDVFNLTKMKNISSRVGITPHRH